MAVELYEHNKKAYLEAKRQIEEAGVSSVVQATGTGKTYIVMKFIEDYADKYKILYTVD